MLLEISRVLTVILGQVKDPKMSLREKDVRRAITQILAYMNSNKPIDYLNNGFMGTVDELRVASYYASRGYQIVRMSYEFQKAPNIPDLDQQPQGEVDVVLEDPKTGELILVEVKSHLRRNKLIEQLKQFIGFQKHNQKVIWDHRCSCFRAIDRIVLFSSAEPGEERVESLLKSHPQIEIEHFPERYQREKVFPRIHRLQTPLNAY
jgi:Holliday junction resolvase-like predicted endonuclease